MKATSCIAFLLFSALTSSGFAQYSFDTRAQSRTRVITPEGKFKTLAQFGAPSLNDRGDVAFSTTIANTRVYGVGFRAKGKSSGRLIIQTPDVLDNEPVINGAPQPVQVERVGVDVALNNARTISYSCNLKLLDGSETGTSGYAQLTRVLRSNPENQSLLVQNTDGTNQIEGFDTNRLSITKTGQIGVTLVNPDATNPLGVTYSIGKASAKWLTPQIAANSGNFIYGLPYEAVFARFGSATLTDKGNLFTVATIGSAGTEPPSSELYDGIWSGKNANLQIVVTKQDKPPGKGTSYDGFKDSISTSPNGKTIVFIAQIAGEVVVLQAQGTAIKRILNVGRTSASDTKGDKITEVESVAVNNAGTIVVLGSSTTGRGIWTILKNGEIQPLAKQGEKIPVKVQSRTTQKTISRLTFNPNSGINNRGQIAFTANFTDRSSAVLIANP